MTENADEPLPSPDAQSATERFISACRDGAVRLGVGVPIQVGLIFAQRVVLNKLGLPDISVPAETAIAIVPTMRITRALMNIPFLQRLARE